MIKNIIVPPHKTQKITEQYYTLTQEGNTILPFKLRRIKPIKNKQKQYKRYFI